MAKKLDFDKKKNNRNDNVIEEIMQADFPLPKQTEDAKNEAFSESEKWQQLLDIRKIQRIWCKDYRRNQQEVRKEIHRNSKIAQEIQNSIQNSFGTDCSCSAVFSTVCITIRHLQRTSLWLEMYLSSSVIPWDFMVIIRNMQSS